MKRVELQIPAVTILKLAASVLVAYCAIQLWPLLLLTFVAALVAITLHPLLIRAERRGLPRWMGISMIVLLMAGALAFFFAILLPEVITQLSGLMRSWPSLRENIISRMPVQFGAREAVRTALTQPGGGISREIPRQLITVGGVALGTLSELVLFLVLTVYLTADGSRSWRWIKGFFDPENQRRLNETGEEVSRVVSAFVAGQLITSSAVTIVTFVALSMLRVPAALVLSILAGIFDVLPIVGFFLSAIPAALLALTVKPITALIVVAVYLAYHAVENYLLVPRIYGNRLRVSTLTVLLSLLAAAMLTGVLGAIAVLPVVASYPIIERIWLRRILGSGVIEAHSNVQSEGQGESERRESA